MSFMTNMTLNPANTLQSLTCQGTSEW